MNAVEITASVTAIGNALACQLSDDQLTLAAAVFTQLGDTLATISVMRELCPKNTSESSKNTTNDPEGAASSTPDNKNSPEENKVLVFSDPTGYTRDSSLIQNSDSFIAIARDHYSLIVLQKVEDAQLVESYRSIIANRDYRGLEESYLASYNAKPDIRSANAGDCRVIYLTYTARNRSGNVAHIGAIIGLEGQVYVLQAQSSANYSNSLKADVSSLIKSFKLTDA